MSARRSSRPLRFADLSSATEAEVLAFAFPPNEPGSDTIAGLLADIERTAVLTTVALEHGLDDDVGRALVAIQHRAAAARTLYERGMQDHPEAAPERWKVGSRAGRRWRDFP